MPQSLALVFWTQRKQAQHPEPVYCDWHSGRDSKYGSLAKELSGLSSSVIYYPYCGGEAELAGKLKELFLSRRIFKHHLSFEAENE